MHKQCYMSYAFIAPNFQLIASLLYQLREWCDETSPDPVRAAIAALIGRNWDIFVSSEEKEEDNGYSISHLFWQMSVTLLQDVEEEVREEMCCSLSEMLSSTCHSLGTNNSFFTNALMCIF